MAMEPLPNLSEQSARIGMWLLAVGSDPRVEEYTYTKGTGKGKGKKFEVLLVSDDSDAYCLGQFRKKGKEHAATNEFKAATEKFKRSSVWKVSQEQSQVFRLLAQSCYRHQRIEIPAGAAEYGHDATSGYAMRRSQHVIAMRPGAGRRCDRFRDSR